MDEYYESVLTWPTSRRSKAEPTKTREQWYNMPGTSAHELNMNVSTSQGPAYGPKARLSMSQKLTTKQGVFLGVGLIILLIILFFLYRGTKHHYGSYY
jgi:hypothetical protein